MSVQPRSVFGQDSDEEENEKAQTRGRRALQRLQELHEEAKSEPFVKVTDEPDEDAIGDDDEEREMARLRTSTNYKKFEKLHGRDKAKAVMEERQTSATIGNHVPRISEAKLNASIGEIAVDANREKRERLSPTQKCVNIIDASSDDEEHLGPVASAVSIEIVPENRASKRPRVADDALRRMSAVSRRKLDPKIIDDSSDDDDSESSDEEQLGPAGVEDKGTTELPLSHEAVLGCTHGGHVSAIVMDAGGGRLYTGAHDGSLKMWDFNTMHWSLQSFGDATPLDEAAVSGMSISGGRSLCWGALPHARILDREARVLVQTPMGDMYLVDAAKSRGHPGPIRGARWLRSNVITVGTEGVVRVWNPEDSRREAMQNIPVMRQTVLVKLRTKRGGRACAQTICDTSDGMAIVGCDDQAVKLVDFRARSATELCAGAVEACAEFTALEAAPAECSAPLLLMRSTGGYLRVYDRRRMSGAVAVFDRLPNTVSETNLCFIGSTGSYFATGTSASRRDGDAAGAVHVFSMGTMRRVAMRRAASGAGSVVCVRWHERTNQVLYGCADGSVRILYDPQLSSGGVLKCIIRERRTKVHGVVADGVGPIMTPDEAGASSGGALRRGRRLASRALQPKAKDGPETSKIGNTRSLAKYVREAGIEQKWDEDPREALLKYDEETKRNPVFTKAYQVTQPQVLLSEKTAEQEQEDTLVEARRKQRAKKDHSSKH